MKTAHEVGIEIETIQAEIAEIINSRNYFGKEIRKMKRRIEFLTGIRSYLLTNPNENFCICEQQRLKKIIKSKEDGFEYWRENVMLRYVTTRQLKSQYNKEVGLPLLKKQLQTINFIVS